MNQCDQCVYYSYDEEYDEYLCSADMDEDDYARLMGGMGISGASNRNSCPCFRDGDEYKVVRHQM
ncbi:MAG: DUF6472 family protein [Lachnospiraceae bacterium]|nr:DUF6472 family protein [Lachnospiraceae bacterium]